MKQSVRSRPLRSREKRQRRRVTRRGAGGPRARVSDTSPERRFSGLRSRFAERMQLLAPVTAYAMATATVATRRRTHMVRSSNLGATRSATGVKAACPA